MIDNQTIASCRAAMLLAATLISVSAWGQAGIRESLERLDVNEDGKIQPEEITPLARPYMERIARSRRMSLDRENDISAYQEAARIYYALKNGVSGRDIEPESESLIKEFGVMEDKEPLIPQFGLAEVKYPYTQEDLDEADRTIRRYDHNEDGYIDRLEASVSRWTHRDPFNMDLNKDDRMSRMELAQRYARRRLLEGASGELVRKAWRTGNGIEPSAVEEKKRDDSQWWRQGGTRTWLTATILGRFDTNRNGRLEMNEALKIGVPVGQIDANRDSELTRDELHAYLTEMQDQWGDETQGLPGWFFELDGNRDGQVEMSEYTDEWTDVKVMQFTSLDTNDDGILTASEVSESTAMTGGSYTNDSATMLPPRKTAISEIEVTDDLIIGDLNLKLSITHTHDSHLDAYLVGPDGHRIELFTEVGGHDDHFEDTLFDDQSRYPITKARPPFRGTFQPEGASRGQPGLSSFSGKNMKGVWQLIIRGTRSERFGFLHNWSLIVRPQEDMPTVGTETALQSDGPQESRIPDFRDARAQAASDARRKEEEQRREEQRREWERKKQEYMARQKQQQNGGREDWKGGGKREEDNSERKAAMDRFRQYIEYMKKAGKEIPEEKRRAFEEQMREYKKQDKSDKKYNK